MTTRQTPNMLMLARSQRSVHSTAPRTSPMAVPPRIWLCNAVLALIAGISALPTLRLLLEGLSGWTQGWQSPLAQVLADPMSWYALRNTLEVGIAGMLLSVLLGALFAGVLCLTDVRGKSGWVFALMLPMMIPPQVTALAWLQLFGPSSTLLQSIGLAPALGSPQPLYSPAGIVLLLGVQHAPLVFLALRSSLQMVPSDLCEAARLAGASQSQVLLQIVAPLARTGLIAGAAMAFVSALGNFGIPAMLGVPVGYYTLPTLIYQKMASFGGGMLAQVAGLAMLVSLLAMLGVGLQMRLQQRSGYRLIGMPGRGVLFTLGRWQWPVQLLFAGVLSLILVAPLCALLMSSLVPAMGVSLTAKTVTLQAYAEMLGRQGVTWRAAGNSLFLAGLAALALTMLALPLAWIMARAKGRWSRRLCLLVNTCIEIPYALPGTVLAVACILLFAKPLPLVQWSLYGTLAILWVAYMVRFAVVALKPVQASLQQLDPALEEAAQLAGANVWQRLRDVLLPLLAPAAFAGGLLVLLTALNELTVSALLWSAGHETLGVLIFNFNESGENILASAVAVVIVLGVAALMAAMSRLGRSLPRGVIPWRD